MAAERSPWSIPLGVLASGVAGLLVSLVHPLPGQAVLAPVCLFCLLYPAMLGLDREGLRAAATRPLVPLLALAMNFVWAPLCIAVIVHTVLAGMPPAQAAGVVLFGIIPTGGMAPAYTAMRGGNVALAVGIMAASHLLGLVFVPLWASLLLDASVAVPTGPIVNSLLLVIALPGLAALATGTLALRRGGPKGLAALRRRTAPLSRLGLLAIIFVVFAAQGRLLLADPLLIPRVCAAAALFLVGTIACGHLLMRLLGRRRDESVPFIYTTTSRNNAIALAVATLAFGGETQLVIAITGAMTQFPVVLAYTLWRGRREGVL